MNLRTPRRRLPLRWRLPNPPPLHTGREREIEWLAQAIERGPVSFVWGLGGIGKTTLLLHVLHRRFAPKIDRALFARLRSDQPLEQLLLDVVQALAEVLDVPARDFAKASDTDALLEALVDLAEEADLWVVLDDLHHAPSATSDHHIATLARYARRSRFVVASRFAPAAPGIDGQVLQLGALADEALIRLARGIDPSLADDRLREVVRQAGGSPWRLLQRISHRVLGDPDDLLGPLDARAAAFLRALAEIRIALPVDVLERVLGPVPVELIESLERRSLIERSERGVSIHDVARPLISTRAHAAAADLGLELARDMAESEQPNVVLEALRLSLERSSETALSLLERRGHALLEGHQAAGLWQLLTLRDHAGFAYWRLRCAVDLGWVDWRHLPEPDADSLAARLLWAKLMFRGALFAECATLTAELATRARAIGDTAMAFEADITHAEALGYSGRYAEAVATLEAVTAPDLRTKARRDALEARWLVHTGAFEAAPRLALAAAAQLANLPDHERTAVAADVLGVFLYLAPPIVSRMVNLEHRDPPPDTLFHPRHYRVARCMLLLNAGRIGEASDTLRELRPLSAPRSAERLYLDLNTVLAALMQGELVDLAPELDRLMAEAEAIQNAEVYYWIAVLRVRLGVLHAVDVTEPPRSLRVPSAPVITDDFLRGARWQRALRSGRAPRGERPVDWRAAAVASVQVLRASLAAEEALLEGAFDEARRCLRRAVDLAADNGRVLQEAELRELACALEAAAGQDDRLREAVLALDALALAFPSPRFAAEVRFFEAVLAGGFPAPEVLESLAQAEWVAPPACRRARALLGAEVALDAIDRAVVLAVRRRVGPIRLDVVVAAPDWRPGWGIDEVRQCVWLPAGPALWRTIDLARAPLLLRCLTTLADCGGAASKETLCMQAWGEAEYHKLRHDKRIQVAVHELRERLEDAPSRPTRIVTTADGYAFGTGEPLRRLRSS